MLPSIEAMEDFSEKKREGGWDLHVVIRLLAATQTLYLIHSTPGPDSPWGQKTITITVTSLYNNNPIIIAEAFLVSG